MTAITAAPRALSTTPRAPSFLGLVRAEIFRTTRQLSTWLMLLVTAAVVVLPWVLLPIIPTSKTRLVNTSLPFITSNIDGTLSLLRVFIGFFIAIMMARLVGLDFQNGTIRVILARGVGRLTLLGAKLTAGAVIALGALIAGLAWIALVATIMVGVTTGTLAPLSALTGTFWANTWLYVVTVGISMVATLLLATAATVVGRSLSFGLAVALAFFPADNFGSLIALIVARVTANDFWLKLPAYFLGPNLNLLPSVWLPTTTVVAQTPRGTITGTQTAFSFGVTPSVSYDLTHSLVVIALYCVAFAAIAYFLTWRKDVQE